jgi:hypothetical protein
MRIGGVDKPNGGADRLIVPWHAAWRQGRFWFIPDFVLKGNAFGIVLLEPRFRGILIGEHLDGPGVTDLLAGGRRPGR